MSESVILSSPLLLILYGLALAVNLFDIVKKTGFFLPVLSAFLTVGTTAYALILGAEPGEAATVLMVFLLLNLRYVKGADK